MPTQRKWRRDSSRQKPKPTSRTPPPIATAWVATTERVSAMRIATAPTDAAWPAAMAGSDDEFPAALLKAAGHREQPAHRGVDAVERAEHHEGRERAVVHG